MRSPDPSGQGTTEPEDLSGPLPFRGLPSGGPGSWRALSGLAGPIRTGGPGAARGPRVPRSAVSAPPAQPPPSERRTEQGTGSVCLQGRPKGAGNFFQLFPRKPLTKS
jgi:hypothetical protein